MEDDGWMSDTQLNAVKRRQPDPNRASILPLYKGEDGVELGWPQWAMDMYNAVTLPKDTLQGYKPTIEDATNFALSVGGGGGAVSSVAPVEADLGMFLGRKAKGADMKKLAKAYSMTDQGINREDIWKQTGWWQKPDGEWSWEMSDDAFQFSPEVMNDLEKRGSSSILIDENFHPAIGQYELHRPYNQLALDDEQVPIDWEGKGKLKLDGADLELRDRYGGSYQAHHGLISARGTKESELRKVVLHEMQHAFQDVEDWKGKGMNPEWTAYARNKLESLAPEEWSDFHIINDEVEKNIERRRRAEEAIKDLEKEDSQTDGLLGELLKEESDKKKDFYRNLIKESMSEYDQLMETAEKSSSTPNFQDFEMVVNDFNNIFGDDDFSMYRREEGEMIANLTMARSNLSEADRVAIPPWEMFDQEYTSGGPDKLPKEEQAWTQEEMNNFLTYWMENPVGSLEDFNKSLKEAMNGRK